MRYIADSLSADLRMRLPVSHAVLSASGLTVHDAVKRVVLSGSRGVKGGYRDDSDIDLSLVVDSAALEKTRDTGGLLRDVVETTMSSWKANIELDCAAVFDKLGCGLGCFSHSGSADFSCVHMRPDCVGLFKLQKGFQGFVPEIGVSLEKAFPLLCVWCADV